MGKKQVERIECNMCEEEIKTSETKNRITIMRDGANVQGTESTSSQIVFDRVCNECAEMLQDKDAVETMVLSFMSRQ